MKSDMIVSKLKSLTFFIVERPTVYLYRLMFTRIIIAHALARLLQHTMTTERKYDRRDVKSDSQIYLSGFDGDE